MLCVFFTPSKSIRNTALRKAWKNKGAKAEPLTAQQWYASCSHSHYREAMKASQSKENRMFKYYLTYQFAVGFHRACGSLPLEHAKKERLLRSAETMIHQFATAIRATDPKDELKHLCVALICVRDCKETLDEAGVNLTREVFSKYEVLHQRLEQICMKASECEGGQLSMFG